MERLQSRDQLLGHFEPDPNRSSGVVWKVKAREPLVSGVADHKMYLVEFPFRPT